MTNYERNGLRSIIDQLQAQLAAAVAERDRLKRGDESCVDDDGTPFASARIWRKACREATDERDRFRGLLAAFGKADMELSLMDQETLATVELNVAFDNLKAEARRLAQAQEPTT
jgi:hypothetical protein